MYTPCLPLARRQIAGYSCEMNLICGIDEAGRGPLVGPVTAAAVVLPPMFETNLLNDSKKLTSSQRERVSLVLRSTTLYGIGWATHYEIDLYNIHRATLLAMKRAHQRLMRAVSFLMGEPSPGSFQGLPRSRSAWRCIQPWEELSYPPLALIDGVHAPELSCGTRCIVGGDRLHAEIMAASVLAKTSRDRWMRAYASIEPVYEFSRHKGYPTQAHKQLIALHGASRIQRRSFRSAKPAPMG